MAVRWLTLSSTQNRLSFLVSSLYVSLYTCSSPCRQRSSDSAFIPFQTMHSAAVEMFTSFIGARLLTWQALYYSILSKLKVKQDGQIHGLGIQYMYPPSRLLSPHYSCASPQYSNSDPGSHSGSCSALPPTARAFFFIARLVQQISFSLVDSRVKFFMKKTNCPCPTI